jgi:cyclase
MWLHFGGEDIHLSHFGPAHTNGDTLVYFTRANVASWGDRFQLNSHPAINLSGGVSTKNWITFIEQGLKVTRPDTTMVPGLGGTTRVADVGTAADVRAMQKYFVHVRAAIGREIQAGTTRDATVERVVAEFPQYKDFRPNLGRFRGRIGAIYDELKAEGVAPRP